MNKGRITEIVIAILGCITVTLVAVNIGQDIKDHEEVATPTPIDVTLEPGAELVALRWAVVRSDWGDTVVITDTRLKVVTSSGREYRLSK